MKCRKKDCDGCAHFVNLQTHPLFRDMQIQDEAGKPVQYEGCIFHVQTMFMMQLWKRQIGVQAAIESRGNETVKTLRTMSNNVAAMGFMALEIPGNEPKRITG